MHGFSREEEEFWRREVPLRLSSPASDAAALLLVDGDRIPFGSRLLDHDIEAAQAICVIAGRTHARRWRRYLNSSFAYVREYGLLPGGNPRVVVPLCCSSWAEMAIGLHRPGRLVGRLGLWLARALVRLGNFTLLRNRVLLIAARSRRCLPRGAAQAGLHEVHPTQGEDYALYLGTPDDNRKTVILPVGTSEPRVILKVASSPKARASLANEAVALEVLARSPISGRVPRILGKIDAGDSLILHEEYRPRCRVGQLRLDDSIEVFLRDLSFVEAGTEPLETHLANLHADPRARGPGWDDIAVGALRAELTHHAQRGAVVRVNRGHGDFAPWNCAWTREGLFVYDWEESCAESLALSDAFYYAMAPTLYLRCAESVQGTLAKVLRLAARVGCASGLREPDVKVHLAIWLLGRSGREILYNELLVQLARSWR